MGEQLYHWRDCGLKDGGANEGGNNICNEGRTATSDSHSRHCRQKKCSFFAANDQLFGNLIT